MACAFGSGPPPLVVDLGCGDVAVAEKVLHFRDIDAGIKE
jgi:hypothetical protein